MIDVQEFAGRLSALGVGEFTSDDVVDLAIAADVRISADIEIDAAVAQRLLAQISPALSLVLLPTSGFRLALGAGILGLVAARCYDRAAVALPTP